MAVADYGKIPIEALLVPDDGKITELTELKGKTIGVKGDIPPSIVAMLANAGLQRGTDYKEVLLDGFDPQAHSAGHRRPARVQVERAGPARRGGHQVQAVRSRRRRTSRDVRALLHDAGLPRQAPDRRRRTSCAPRSRVRRRGRRSGGAVAMSVDAINAAGNQNFLTEAGETYRWQQESATVDKGTPSGPVGLIDPAMFMNEVAAYTRPACSRTARRRPTAPTTRRWPTACTTRAAR